MRSSRGMAIFLIVVALCITDASSARSTARCTSPCVISLEGEWRFMPGNRAPSNQYATPVDDTQWSRIVVPANWHSQGYELSGSAWYRRHFAAPAELAGKQVRLVFPGVDYAADVWLNGEYVGGFTKATSSDSTSTCRT